MTAEPHEKTPFRLFAKRRNRDRTDVEATCERCAS